MKQIFVESEFAPLRRVVLAQSEFGLPDKDKIVETEFLPEDNENLLKGAYGDDIANIYPDLQKRWELEKDIMEKVLTSYGIEVKHPRLLTDYEKQTGKSSGNGYSNFFTRDPFITIGSIIIEGNLRFSHRRFEFLPVRDILIEESRSNDGIFVALPKVDISLGELSEVGPFLEGGDVLVLGKNVFVGYSGLASNLNGIKWLSAFLKHWDYNVIPVKLHPRILHLDCALSLIKNGLMIICEEALLDGIPSELRKWDKINISLADASELMANGLPINESVYVTDCEFEALIDKIQHYSVKVEAIDYKISRLFGGSFRCTTQSLLRL